MAATLSEAVFFLGFDDSNVAYYITNQSGKNARSWIQTKNRKFNHNSEGGDWLAASRTHAGNSAAAPATWRRTGRAGGDYLFLCAWTNLEFLRSSSVKPAVILVMRAPVTAKPARKGQVRPHSRRKNTGHGSNAEKNFISGGFDLDLRLGLDWIGFESAKI